MDCSIDGGTEEVVDYYKSIAELNDDLWAIWFHTELPFWTDATSSACGYETTHKHTNTKKKSEKQKMKEQRAKK